MLLTTGEGEYDELPCAPPHGQHSCRFERCCFLPWSWWKGNQGSLGTEKFHLVQGVLSHMAGEEVERESRETDASGL